MVLSLFVRVERCLFAQVEPAVMAQNAKGSNHVPRASRSCQADSTIAIPNSMYLTMVSIGPQSLSRIRLFV